MTTFQIVLLIVAITSICLAYTKPAWVPVQALYGITLILFFVWSR
jgi:membrane-bound ClpP family serine protease